MARKVKLPLDMGNDVMVRDIDELKESYNAEKVVEYFLNKQLLTWINDRYYDTEAEAVERLAKEESREGLPAKLAEIFGVTLESEVDAVAFDQADLGDILDEGIDVIYLCGEKFRIPYGVQGKRYIGVNEPLVDIKAEGEIDLESRERGYTHISKLDINDPAALKFINSKDVIELPIDPPVQ